MGDKYPIASETVAQGFDRPTPEQKTVVVKTLAALLDVLNDTPPELMETVLVSLFTTVCMNAPQPKLACVILATAVADGVDDFVAKQANQH